MRKAYLNRVDTIVSRETFFLVVRNQSNVTVNYVLVIKVFYFRKLN